MQLLSNNVCIFLSHQVSEIFDPYIKLNEVPDVCDGLVVEGLGGRVQVHHVDCSLGILEIKSCKNVFPLLIFFYFYSNLAKENKTIWPRFPSLNIQTLHTTKHGKIKNKGTIFVYIGNFRVEHTNIEIMPIPNQ